MKLTRLNELIEKGKKIQGRWALDENHEIQYREEGETEEVKLRASLLEAEPEALVLSVTEKQREGRIVTSLFKLTGSWQLDDKNRITFEVERKFGKRDVLTFKNIWEVGKSHALIYTYEKENLRTKTKELKALVFKGAWILSEVHELTYSLGTGSRSAFRFRGTFQTRSLLAKEGEIRYQVGVEVLGRERLRTIVLFGKWKLSNDLSLSFEMEYGDGRKSSLLFGAEYRLGEGNQLLVKLKTKHGKIHGMELILTRDFLENRGQAFLRLRKTLEESALEAGVRFPW